MECKKWYFTSVGGSELIIRLWRGGADEAIHIVLDNKG